MHNIQGPSNHQPISRELSKRGAREFSLQEMQQITQAVTAPPRPIAKTPTAQTVLVQKTIVDTWAPAKSSKNADDSPKLAVLSNFHRALSKESGINPSPAAGRPLQTEVNKPNQGVFNKFSSILSSSSSSVVEGLKVTQETIETKVKIHQLTSDVDKQIKSLEIKFNQPVKGAASPAIAAQLEADKQTLESLKLLKVTISENPTLIQSKIFENQQEPLYKSFGPAKFLSYLLASEKDLKATSDLRLQKNDFTDSDRVAIYGYVKIDHLSINANTLNERGGKPMEPGIKEYRDALTSALAKDPEVSMKVDLKLKLQDLNTLYPAIAKEKEQALQRSSSGPIDQEDVVKVYIPPDVRETLQRLELLEKTLETNPAAIKEIVANNQNEPTFKLLGPTGFISYLLMSNKNVAEHAAATGDHSLQAINLSDTEKVALFGYTTGDFRQMNSALRNPDRETSKDPQLQSYIQATISALNKLPDIPAVINNEKVVLTRIINPPLPQMPGFSDPLAAEKAWKEANLGDNAVYMDRAFGSTSLQDGSGAYKLIFNSTKNVKDIGPFSAFPGEKEIVIPPGTRFKVITSNADHTIVTLQFSD